MHQDRISLTLQERHHHELRSFLFPDDGREAVAIILCTKQSGHGRTRLLSSEIYAIPYHLCHEREVGTVRWPTSAIEDALNRAAAKGLSVIKVHSHPTGTRRFSRMDDEADRALFPSIDSWVRQPVPHASCIMLPDGSMFGRAVNCEGKFDPLDLINVVNDDLSFWFHENFNDNVPETAKRIAQAFGDGTYRTMRRLRIGIGGCSGTGNPIITDFNLNHVGELYLVDRGIAEDKNRNRIATLTPQDIADEMPKVINQKNAIEARGLGTKTTSFQSEISDPDIIRAFGSCDILIGSFDSATGRHFLNKISSCFLIPYFDMGVRIDADEKTGQITRINASMHFIKPAGSSLLSRGVYTMAQVDAEDMKDTDPEEFSRQIKEGYVKGLDVERPAVSTINGFIAHLTADEIISRINGYRIAGNAEFAIRRMVFTMGELLNEADDGAECPVFSGLVARGDAYPLLGLHMLEKAA